ncbi:MAG: Archaeal PaREP1/PaREP8 family protein [Candidatus Scalindua rubra]|uniref:Archaeal PaREP1/PaREP8 family protein n=1 Tax=Candidatus Scalindua rubra TaxID=1872076 RepID=A0A1E3X3L5_9BACT|nr:MAG: Archaeal PaREP1/PaREP8 family protein [Candidatus Scalindua rubra]
MKNGKMRRYAELSDKYIDDAKILLKNSDLAQASERLWGAFASIVKVKAVASKRNKQIKTHDGISFYVSSISKELKDESLINASLTVNAMHQNFYENSLTIEHVRKRLKTIRQFAWCPQIAAN